MLSFKMSQNEYSSQKKKLSNRLEIELNGTYGSFEEVSSYYFEKRKETFLSRIIKPKSVEVASCREAGKFKHSGFIIRANNSDLISKIRVSIHQFGRYDLVCAYGGD
jgi:hypothetical protein